MTQGLAAQFEAQLKTDIDSYYTTTMATIYDGTVCSSSTPSPPPMYFNGSSAYTNTTIATDQYKGQYVFDPNNQYGFLDPTNFSGIPIPDVEEAQAYYSIIALGAYVLTVPPSGGCSNTSTNTSEPLISQKEISSDGNVNVEDAVYPSMPFFLYANPELLRYNLEPSFHNHEGGFYPNGYYTHDLGTNFSNATGHTEGNVEFSGNFTFIQEHYVKLQQWVSYLIYFSLTQDASSALTTSQVNSFNQVDLAIQSIVGISAMACVATLANGPTSSQNYSTTASTFYKQWEEYAIDSSGRHTMLSYQ